MKEEKKMQENILEKLSNIQNELKAPKNQKNNFGNYKYRSAEDILEAVKPILKKHRISLVISDELVVMGENNPVIYKETYYDKDLKKENERTIVSGASRFYIKATATLYDLDSDKLLSNTAFAREEESKKGMDGSQVTGTASSYARKYALNGLFNIDDTKDADTDEYQKETNVVAKPKTSVNHRDMLIKYIKDKEMDFAEVAKEYKLNSTTEDTRFKEVLEILQSKEVK